MMAYNGGPYRSNLNSINHQVKQEPTYQPVYPPRKEPPQPVANEEGPRPVPGTIAFNIDMDKIAEALKIANSLPPANLTNGRTSTPPTVTVPSTSNVTSQLQQQPPPPPSPAVVSITPDTLPDNHEMLVQKLIAVVEDKTKTKYELEEQEKRIANLEKELQPFYDKQRILDSLKKSRSVYKANWKAYEQMRMIICNKLGKINEGKLDLSPEKRTIPSHLQALKNDRSAPQPVKPKPKKLKSDIASTAKSPRKSNATPNAPTFGVKSSRPVASGAKKSTTGVPSVMKRQTNKVRPAEVIQEGLETNNEIAKDGSQEDQSHLDLSNNNDDVSDKKRKRTDSESSTSTVGFQEEDNGPVSPENENEDESDLSDSGVYAELNCKVEPGVEVSSLAKTIKTEKMETTISGKSSNLQGEKEVKNSNDAANGVANAPQVQETCQICQKTFEKGTDIKEHIKKDHPLPIAM